MCKIVTRSLSVNLPPDKSAFLWGPRKTGKSYWLHHVFPEAYTIDLLKTDVFAEYAASPSLLRQRVNGPPGGRVLIDEVQMLPELLNEVHWLIENRGVSFILTGSSARKLRRGHANLLGGRAWRYEMLPLTYRETKGFDLEKVMISGLLPPHFLSPNPVEDLRAYVGDYLKEEIAAEARHRSISQFSAFMRVSAMTNSELLNYTNVARESGVNARVVREYFQILEDTLVGFRLPPWRRAHSRRLIETEKFYWFDVGVSNFLGRRAPKLGSTEFGKSFEHFILMELRAWNSYQRLDMPLAFWRTASGLEVDFILGDFLCAIEVKGASRVHDGDLGSLRALCGDHRVKHALVVCLEKEPRTLSDGIQILPWRMFLERLWAGDYNV